MNAPLEVDLLIEARWVIPVIPENITLEHHALAIKHGKIVALLPIEEARVRYQARQTQSLPNHVLLPGLIDAHTHAPLRLAGRLISATHHSPCLSDATWPEQLRQASAQFTYDGTRLAAAEMLTSGITCCHDQFFFPEESARAYTEAGMRAVIGLLILETPSNYAASSDEYFSKGLKARDDWKDHPQINFSLAPYAPQALSMQSLEQVSTLAEELDTSVHTHLHETAQEIAYCIRQDGARPFDRLETAGLIGPRLHVAHANFLTEAEQQHFAQNSCSVIRNAASGIRNQSGSVLAGDLSRQGITVALGTDGPLPPHRLDMIESLRCSALQTSLAETNSPVLTAHQLIRMATINGAKTLGMEHCIGSLQPDFEADLCAVELQDLSQTSAEQTPALLVYESSKESVSHVWVAGKKCVQEGILLHTSNKELVQTLRVWQNTGRPW